MMRQSVEPNDQIFVKVMDFYLLLKTLAKILVKL